MPPYGDWEYYPTETWNYGLSPDTADPSAEVEMDGPGETPFDSESPLMALRVDGRRIQEWYLEDNRAGQIPASPTRSTAATKELSLVPYGATQLRMTEFPVLEDTADPDT